MRFSPRALCSPNPKLALTQVTDFTDRGLARYRLSEIDTEVDDQTPLLEFYGISNGEVEAFLLAWHRGDVFRVHPGRYIWYMSCRERAAEAEQRWLGLAPDSDHDETESALVTYREGQLPCSRTGCLPRRGPALMLTLPDDRSTYSKFFAATRGVS